MQSNLNIGCKFELPIIRKVRSTFPKNSVLSEFGYSGESISNLLGLFCSQFWFALFSGFWLLVFAPFLRTFLTCNWDLADFLQFWDFKEYFQRLQLLFCKMGAYTQPKVSLGLIYSKIVSLRLLWVFSLTGSFEKYFQVNWPSRFWNFSNTFFRSFPPQAFLILFRRNCKFKVI